MFTWISVEQKLKSVVDDDHFHSKKKSAKYLFFLNPKPSVSIFGLSTFCRVLKSFPDVRVRCIVLALKNGHANRRHHSRKKFWWNRSEEWLEVAMGRKKDRRWKHRSVYSKNMKLFVMIMSFSVHFWSEIRAPECSRFASRFTKILGGGMPPNSPTVWLTFRFLDFHSITPLVFNYPAM